MASTSNQIKLLAATAAHRPGRSCSTEVGIPVKKNQISILELNRESVDRCLEILEWRLKTLLPVVKPVRFEFNHKRPLSPLKHQHSANRSPQQFQKLSAFPQSLRGEIQDQSSMENVDASCEVLVQIQEIKFLLSDIKLLSFPQVVYLLKQMMIGYEVLVDVFGIFEPSAQMIGANGANQWKMWINSNFKMNAISAKSISQKEFIQKLILIAERRCLETSISKRLFMELKKICHSQLCLFVKVLQRIKQFAVSNKVYIVNTVTLPKEQRKQEKTLKKQKGYYRIDQLKSSLIDGKFVPKEVWTYKTQKNDPSVCSIGDLDLSPVRNMVSMRGQYSNQTNHNNLSTAWKTHSQLHDYLTPHQKNNPDAIHLYSPQMGETQRSPIRPNKQAVSPKLSFTTSNSLIERRRRLDQVRCIVELDYSSQNSTKRNHHNEVDKNQSHLKRQIATKGLKQIDCKQSNQIDLMNSYNKSSSTELIESQVEKSTIAYKNLKKNDFQSSAKSRNNQSGFVKINIPIYQKNDNKNLSISYQFKTKNKQKEKEHQQGSDHSINWPWKNTISGLFSDTATVGELKTSIKLKTPKGKKQEKKYLSDVNLQILSKMGRQANDSFDEDEEQNIKIDLQMTQLKLAEQSLMFKNQAILKDEEEDQILRRPTSSNYSVSKIVIICQPRQKRNIHI